MKTFKDLEFETHSVPTLFDKQALLHFDNGYGVSVINGNSAYCDRSTYEVGIMYNKELTYNTELTDDVMTYQTEEDITKTMIYLQNLK